MTSAQVQNPVAATPTPNEATQSGRDGQGRFTVGNPGGPGNPFARRTAAMRQAISNAATVEDMDAISKKMIALAKDGNTAAAKLCYQYIAGKPTEPPNPDRLDADEWQRFQETAGMMVEMPGLLDKPDAVLPLTAVRQYRPEVTRAICGRMGVALRDPDAFHAAEEKAREAHFRQLERDSLRAAAKYDGFVPDETGLPPEVKPIQPKANGKNGRKQRSERSQRSARVSDPADGVTAGLPAPDGDLRSGVSAGSETRAERIIPPSADRFIEELPDWCPPIPVSDEPIQTAGTCVPPEVKPSRPKANGKNGCAAKRRRSSVGVIPTRQLSLQPVAIGAAR